MDKSSFSLLKESVVHGWKKATFHWSECCVQYVMKGTILKSSKQSMTYKASFHIKSIDFMKQIL
jgi:hypothetical protein